ncbi:hypothetical protein [Sphingobacterium hungaricum]
MNSLHKEKQQSQAEVFSKKAGVLISSQFIEIGYVKTIKVLLVIYMDMINGRQEMAIRFENHFPADCSKTRVSKVGTIDEDELDVLIKSISILKNQVFQSYPEHYTEVSFLSRAGLEVGSCFADNSWDFFLKLDQNDDSTNVSLAVDDAQVLLDILQKLKGHIINLK